MPRKTTHVRSEVRFWALKRVSVEAWGSAPQRVLAKMVGQDPQMG